MEVIVFFVVLAFVGYLYIFYKIVKLIDDHAKRLDEDRKKFIEWRIKLLQELGPPVKIDSEEFSKRADMFLYNVFDLTKGHNHERTSKEG